MWFNFNLILRLFGIHYDNIHLCVRPRAFTIKIHFTLFIYLRKYLCLVIKTIDISRHAHATLTSTMWHCHWWFCTNRDRLVLYPFKFITPEENICVWKESKHKQTQMQTHNPFPVCVTVFMDFDSICTVVAHFPPNLIRFKIHSKLIIFFLS